MERRDDGRASPVSVVVPVYNSEASLPELSSRIDQVFRQIGRPYELILVNDGSADHSWRVITMLAGSGLPVVGLDLSRNFGQHNALLAGIRHARYEIIVTMDDDLQNPPEEVPTLLAELERQQVDLVYGVPPELGHERWRNAMSVGIKWVLRHFMGAETAQQVSAFRAFRTHLRDAFSSYRGSFVSIDVLMTWATTRIGSAIVHHARRPYGRSNYRFRRLLTHAFNMITGFSTLPLQVASYVGFFFTLFGIGVLVYVVGRYLLIGVRVPGFAFLASIIALFSGAQLFALGIIGEYLSRMHFRVMDKPAYSIRSEINAGELASNNEI